MFENHKLKKLFSLQKTDDTFIQIIRYFITGFIAVGFDFALLIFLTEVFKIYYLISVAFGFMLGVTTNYFLTTSWVFHKRKLSNKIIEYSVYALTGVVGLILTELIIWFFTEDLNFHYVVSKGISFVTVYFTNYFIRRSLLF